MFWRSDAREKCRFPDCDYTSLSDGYLLVHEEFFLSFFVFFERHERLKTKRRDERKILRFTRGRKGINTTKKTHTKKREKKKFGHEFRVFEMCVEKTNEKKRFKKIREQKCPPPLHTAFDFERLYAVVFSKREEDNNNNNNNNNRHHDRDHARESDDDDDEKEDAKGRGYRRHGRGNVRRRRFGRGGRE